MKSLSINLAIGIAMALPACKKQDASTNAGAAAIAVAVQQTQAVSVGASTTTPGDSVYVIGTCANNSHRETILFSNLPSAVVSYLATNYNGYNFINGFSIKDVAGTLTGYLVIVQYNGNPVGLKFDASGSFVKVLEQREGHDLLGRGFHDGGDFQNRDGRQRDTIALSSLPSSILSYLNLNYNQDTLVRASRNHDGGYVVLSRNINLFATLFSSSGIFITRIQLPANPGRGTPIDQSALPANIQVYLSATFPGYIFNKAFSILYYGIIQGYCVVIDANNTKYAVQFDTSGNFIKVKTIH